MAPGILAGAMAAVPFAHFIMARRSWSARSAPADDIAYTAGMPITLSLYKVFEIYHRARPRQSSRGQLLLGCVLVSGGRLYGFSCVAAGGEPHSQIEGSTRTWRGGAGVGQASWLPHGLSKAAELINERAYEARAGRVPAPQFHALMKSGGLHPIAERRPSIRPVDWLLSLWTRGPQTPHATVPRLHAGWENPRRRRRRRCCVPDRRPVQRRHE